MKNPERMDAGISRKNEALQDREGLNSSNLLPGHEKSKSEAEIAKNTVARDAAAMVKILDKMKSGWEPYEVVYDSLKDKHGKSFEYHFREILSGRELADE